MRGIRGVQESGNHTSDEWPHLRPSDPMHLDGIDSVRNPHPMRPRDELATIDHIADFVNSQDQMRPPVPNHLRNQVRARIRGPSLATVVKVEEIQRGVVDERSRNLLAEGGHQAKLWLSVVQEDPVELRRLHAAGKDRQVMFSGGAWHKQFILARMGILPQTDGGVGKRLSGIVGGKHA